MKKPKKKFAPTMSPELPEGLEKRVCLISAEEIGHVAFFLHELEMKTTDSKLLKTELSTAIVFCQRAMATPPIEDVIFQDEEWNEEFHKDFVKEEFVPYKIS